MTFAFVSSSDRLCFGSPAGRALGLLALEILKLLDLGLLGDGQCALDRVLDHLQPLIRIKADALHHARHRARPVTSRPGDPGESRPEGVGCGSSTFWNICFVASRMPNDSSTIA